jgi:hypothetical protein
MSSSRNGREKTVGREEIPVDKGNVEKRVRRRKLPGFNLHPRCTARLSLSTDFV